MLLCVDVCIDVCILDYRKTESLTENRKFDAVFTTTGSTDDFECCSAFENRVHMIALNRMIRKKQAKRT